MDSSGISSNLSSLLEKINQEQLLLSQQIHELQQRKDDLEANVGMVGAECQELQDQLNDLEKEILYTEYDIKSANTRCRSLMNNEDDQSALSSVLIQLEDVKVQLDCDSLITNHLKEFADLFNTEWDEYIRNVLNYEQIQHGNGRETLKSQKDKLMSKYDELKSDGSLEDIDNAIASSISVLNKCQTEKFEIEKQFEKLTHIIDERTSILRRIEVENRIEKNKWQAEKNRLVSLISSAKNDC